jgi:DNA repair protein RadD
MNLYPYQSDVIAKWIASPCRKTLLVSPTGSGKTVMCSEIIKHYADEHKPVLVLAHRREIIGQIGKKLFACGVNHGIIQAGHPSHPMRSVQVASVATVASRSLRGSTPLPPADLVVIDEAHHTPAKTYRKIVEAYPDAKILGLTATPCRGDGRGLGHDFDEIIEAPQIPELIDQKFLVRPIYYTTTKPPDLKGVRVRGGDYVEGDLAVRLDRPELVGDVVGHYLKHGQGRKCVVFAINVQHSIHLCEEFARQGIKAGHIDGSTPIEERKATLKQVENRELDVVTNCMVLTEGWDCAAVSCVILARPTKQRGMYLQMVGRGLRTSPGKTDCIVLDHSGAVHRLGRADEHIVWTLDPDKRAVNPAQEKRKRDGIEPCTCTQCGAMRFGGMACDECGFLPKRQGAAVDIIDGELGLLDAGNKVKQRVYSIDEKIEWIAGFNYMAAERAVQGRPFKGNWPFANFLAKFGNKPPVYTNQVAPRTPTPEMRAWVRSRQIAFAKSTAA